MAVGVFVRGRGIAPLFFRFWRESVVMFGSLIVMTGGILLILLTENFLSLTVGASLAHAQPTHRVSRCEETVHSPFAADFA